MRVSHTPVGLTASATRIDWTGRIAECAATGDPSVCVVWWVTLRHRGMRHRFSARTCTHIPGSAQDLCGTIALISDHAA